MLLSFTLFLSILLYMWTPSLFMPAIFLGPLAIYVLGRKYFVVIIWIAIITLLLEISSLTPWWTFLLFYGGWCLSFYILSLFIERIWPVQSIFAILCLLFTSFILYGTKVDYLNLAIYILVNSVCVTIFIFAAEKFNLYEKYI